MIKMKIPNVDSLLNLCIDDPKLSILSLSQTEKEFLLLLIIGFGCIFVCSGSGGVLVGLLLINAMTTTQNTTTVTIYLNSLSCTWNKKKNENESLYYIIYFIIFDKISYISKTYHNMVYQKKYI